MGLGWLRMFPTKEEKADLQRIKCLEHMAENCDKVGNLIVKGDQENSMSYLSDQIVEIREEAKTVVGESPVQSKGSLGMAESGAGN